jgi:vacuolar-type H+-ATPase subunit H
MDNDLLRDVIEKEKEIQRSLEQATLTAEQGLEARKKEIQEECAEKEKIIQNAFEQARERARYSAQDKASDIVKQAEQQAEWFGRVTDETLARIVANHISKILPE